MVSARKQERSASKALHGHEQPSPLPFPGFANMTAGSETGGSDDADSSLAEDEEFATEEHAHRCARAL